MKPGTIEKLLGSPAPAGTRRKKQNKEQDSAPNKQNAAVDERWINIQKPDMSTEGEWMDVDVTTQPASGESGTVDMCSDPLDIALTLRKALAVQWEALSEGSMLKKKAQEKQVLDQLKKMENNAQQFIASIEVWKATAKEVQIEFKDLNEGGSK